MKTITTFTIMICFGFITSLFSQESEKPVCFFKSSNLHYTAHGMEYWYNKSQGGLETITGVPYNDPGCKKCQASSCDICNVVEKDRKFIYSEYFADC
ncbi:MAG: hypothetical protein WCE54_05105 [Ignavibacteriaceae bacterium]